MTDTLRRSAARCRSLVAPADGSLDIARVFINSSLVGLLPIRGQYSTQTLVIQWRRKQFASEGAQCRREAPAEKIFDVPPPHFSLVPPT